ncbi:hypothetical protein HYZ97_04075 [Candidatus Pacearchaeota archaeon]|nr:hypothetical protein [Candidatus Pacearchaeota archaeon]
MAELKSVQLSEKKQAHKEPKQKPTAPAQQKKEEKPIAVQTTPTTQPVQPSAVPQPEPAAPSETKKELKPENKRIKKEEAIANGVSLHASKKHCMYICTFIKNKPIDLAIKELEEVTLFKRAIPFKGEIPHRKGDMMSGRYPITAARLFITILKGLKGNVVVNGLDLDKTRITWASASWASRPARRGGTRFKRSNVVLKAREIMEAKK